MAIKHHKKTFFSARALPIETSGIGCIRWTLAICNRGCWCTMLLCLNPWTALKSTNPMFFDHFQFVAIWVGCFACFFPFARVCSDPSIFFSSSRSPRSSSSRSPPRAPSSPESQAGLNHCVLRSLSLLSKICDFSNWFGDKKGNLNFGKTSLSSNQFSGRLVLRKTSLGKIGFWTKISVGQFGIWG